MWDKNKKWDFKQKLMIWDLILKKFYAWMYKDQKNVNFNFVFLLFGKIVFYNIL